MIIRPFCSVDIAPFLTLAAAENWLAESWEFELLLSQFPQGCFTAVADNGDSAGFVTSMLHERSGWIGNLIVSIGYRGQGVGEELFITALDALKTAGGETFWLTASTSGQALYEKHGFTVIDTIVRWVGAGHRRHVTPPGSFCTVDSLLNDIDYRAWGDRRTALMSATIARGKLLQQQSGFAVVQPCGSGFQIGPFSALEGSCAESLLDDALHTIPSGAHVYLDAPILNRMTLRLYKRKGMRISGSNKLMYAGVKPSYRPEYLFGLATMGSCG